MAEIIVGKHVETMTEALSSVREESAIQDRDGKFYIAKPMDGYISLTGD